MNLLTVSNLSKHYPVRSGVLGRVRNYVKAIDDVHFYLKEGEILGIVGESGCGKTTAGRSVLRLVEPTSGSILFKGIELKGLNKKKLGILRPEMQMVFQDPNSSLNPRLTVLEIIGEGLLLHKIAGSRQEMEKLVQKTLERVGLPDQVLYRYPHEFSGGQRQRIAIARAIALNPSMIVCDEPVSALDVSIQAQIINLLFDLRKNLGIAYLFIAHDLAVVRQISDRIAVMYLGKIVETAPADELFDKPAHPYTLVLLSAIPGMTPGLRKKDLLPKEAEEGVSKACGCCFSGRCPMAEKRCSEQAPPEVRLSPTHTASCWLI